MDLSRTVRKELSRPGMNHAKRVNAKFSSIISKVCSKVLSLQFLNKPQRFKQRAAGFLYQQDTTEPLGNFAAFSLDSIANYFISHKKVGIFIFSEQTLNHILRYLMQFIAVISLASSDCESKRSSLAITK